VYVQFSIFAVCADYGWIGGNLGFFLHAEAVGGAGGGGVLEYSDASWPECGEAWGDSDRYDLIVDSGRRLWRVQVKSTRYVGERRFSITARGCTAAYTEDEIDFLAVYIVPLDFWYVIPVIIRFLRPGSVCGSIPRTRVRSGEIRNIGKRGG
jgi:hypothetical protein